MAGYSRESKRQNDALQSILRGENPEKRIFVAQNDGESKKRVKEEREGQQKGVIEKLEATKAARVPWFCPECKKVMKTQLDDKMWYLYDHCFDCQVKIETKMRIDGTYDDWVEKKINANKLAWVQEQKELIEEFKKQKAPEYLQQVNPDGYSVNKEKWNIDMNRIHKEADNALEHLQKIEDSLK